MEGQSHTGPPGIQRSRASPARDSKGISGRHDATRGTVSSAHRKVSRGAPPVCARCQRRSPSVRACDKVGKRCECVSVAKLIAHFETAGVEKAKVAVARPMAQQPRGSHHFKMSCSKSPSRRGVVRPIGQQPSGSQHFNSSRAQSPSSRAMERPMAQQPSGSHHFKVSRSKSPNPRKVRQNVERSPKGSQIIGADHTANSLVPTSKVQAFSRFTGADASSSAKRGSPCVSPVMSATSDSVTDTALQKCQRLLEQLGQTVGVDAPILTEKDRPRCLTRMYLQSTSHSIADAALQKSQLLLEKLDQLGLLQDAESNNNSASVLNASIAASEVITEEDEEDLDSAVIADLTNRFEAMRARLQSLRSKVDAPMLPEAPPVAPFMSSMTNRERKTLSASFASAPAWQFMSSIATKSTASSIGSVSTECSSWSTPNSTSRSLASTLTSSASSFGSYSMGSRQSLSGEDEDMLEEVRNLLWSS